MRLLAAIILSLLCVGAQAQARHDPLNEREVDQMRDSAQDPKRRVELLVGFSRERMLAIERLRSTAKPGAEVSGTMADLLGDLASLIDEMDDNLSMYNGHSEDLRRPLRHVLDMEKEFQEKLTLLDEQLTPLQKRRIAAALEDATDSLKTSSESARAMLADQIQKKGEEKDKEKLDRQEAKQAKGEKTSGAEHQPPPDYTGMSGAGKTPPPE